LSKIENMVNKYIKSCRRVLKELRSSSAKVKACKEVSELIEWAENYLKDAEFYLREGELEVSLATIAYCEGLLDALRLLGLAEFEW